MARGKKEIKQKKIKAIQENGVVSDKTYPLNIIRMPLFSLFCYSEQLMNLDRKIMYLPS
jgi:hypothetical protein